MQASRWLSVLVVGLLVSVADGGLAGLGEPADDQTSLGYDWRTGAVWLDAPWGQRLAAVEIASQTADFSVSRLAENPDLAELLVCPLGEDCPDQSIFLASWGDGFGSLALGEVLSPGLPAEFLLEDLSVAGALQDSGPLGPVDLIYVPEPSGSLLAAAALAGLAAVTWRRGTGRV